MMKRSITHWTAGGGKASALDKEHYHVLTQDDGSYVHGTEEIEDNMVTSDGDYAAHTLNLNTGSMGMALCGMREATESPYFSGPSPINEHQFERHCAMVAEKHLQYGIPINENTCLTHAEVQPRLGIKQRGKWDLTRLPFKPELRGAFPVGDYLRERVKFYASEITGQPIPLHLPILKMGSRGQLVLDWQVQLRDLGYAVGHTDKHFGARTRDATMAFQADQGLTPDGVVGDGSRAAMLKAKARPLREVTEADLEARGSSTIKNAKKAEGLLSGAETMTAGGLSVTAVLETARSIGAAEGALDTVQRLFVQYWPILLIGGLIILVTRYGKQIMREIRKARVVDAQTGRNLSR